MDVPRGEGIIRRRRIRRGIMIVVILGAIGGITWGVSRLEPAAPTVEGSTVWPDTVKRGEMLRRVRGNGTLVPIEVRLIPARTQGRVEERLVLPGAIVTVNTVILILSNPELEQEVFDAEWQLKAAEAEFRNLKVQLESQVLNQRAAAAGVESDFRTAKLEADRNAQLAKEGLVSDLNMQLSQVRAETLAIRDQIEKQRLDISSDAVQAQLAVQEARLEQLRAQLDLRRSQLDSLRVRAGIEGVIQQVSVEVGQLATLGTVLATVVQPDRLKAAIRVPETQAKDVQIGLKAEVDTRNGIIPGHVIRIDPASQDGTVTVDVALEGDLPRGARPDLSVDGTIEIERLDDVLYVGRPAFGQAESTVGLFRYEPDGKCATRVQVKFGRSSVNTIEVVEGLREGDRVILSDTSQWDAYDRICLR